MKFISITDNSHFESVKTMLEEENNIFGHSFLCNINVIEKLFKQKQMCCALNDEDEVIAFIVYDEYRSYENIVDATIMVVNHNQRKKGIGSFLYEQFEIFIKEEKKAYVITIECAPIESKEYWISKGFEEWPELEKKSAKYLYKILGNKITNAEEENSVKLEFWNISYYSEHLIKQNEPDTTLFLNDIKNNVVFYGYYDQPVRISYKGRQKSEKLKRTPLNEYCQSSFVIINADDFEILIDDIKFWLDEVS